MPIPVSTRSSRPYVLLSERGSQSAPKFMLGALRADVMADLADKAGKLDENATIRDQAEVAREALAHGLRGWTGWFFDDDGKEPVPFDTKDGAPTPETIGLLDLAVQVELMRAIFDINRVSREEEKN